MHSFKKAVKTVFLFSLLVAVIISTVCAPYFYGEYYYYQDGYVRRDLAGTLDLFVSGSSETLRAVSPEILDQKLGCCAYNLASPLMPMKTRYFLMKKEIARNPVDTVLVDISLNTLFLDWTRESIEGQFYTLGRLPNPIDRIHYAVTNIRLDDALETVYDAMNRGLVTLKAGGAPRGSCLYYTTKGFNPLAANPIEPATLGEYETVTMGTTVVEENRKYLEKIIKLCVEKDIDVILFSTPYAEASMLRYQSLDEVNNTIVAISNMWNIPYYNFNLYRGRHLVFQDATDYYDNAHLSTSGAEKLSALLADATTAHRDGTDISHWFYSSFREMIDQEILPYAG